MLNDHATDDDDFTDVEEYIESHRDSINRDTVLKIYCTSQFEENTPETARIKCENGYLQSEFASFDEFDSVGLDEILDDIGAYDSYDFLEGITPEIMDALMDEYTEGEENEEEEK